MSRDNINQTLLGSKNDEEEAVEPEIIEPSMLEESEIVVEPDKYSSLTRTDPMQVFMFETIGMALFSFGITCAFSEKEADAEIYLSLVLAIIIAGFLSGASLNPCITVLGLIRKHHRLTLKLAGLQVFAQIIGALIGGGLGYVLAGNTVHGFVPQRTDAAYLIKCVAGQALGCFLFVFFVLQISNPNTTHVPVEIEAYMSICLFVYIGRRYTPLSGMSLNFTVMACYGILAWIQHGETQHFKYLWVYLVGDMLGMVAAVKFYENLYEPAALIVRKMRKSMHQHQVKH